VAIVRATCELPTQEASNWRQAFRSTQVAWQDSYQGVPVGSTHLEPVAS
jgi:hypothetical protein